MSTIPNSADNTTSHEVVGFAIIPNWMTRDPAVTPMMIAVYVTVSGHCGQRGAWQISHQTLADEVGVAAITIKRTLVALREIGVLDWDTPADPRRGCTYRLTYPLDLQRSTPQISSDPPPRSPMIYTEEQREEPRETPPTPADAGGVAPTLSLVMAPTPEPKDPFDEFWSIYPRRVAKAAARKSWATAVKHTRPEVIIAALRAQLPTPAFKGRTPDKIPHPTTWLNQERWNDEIERRVAVGDQYAWLPESLR